MLLPVPSRANPSSCSLLPRVTSKHGWAIRVAFASWAAIPGLLGGEKRAGKAGVLYWPDWPVGRRWASLRKSGFLAQTKGLRGAGVSCPCRYPRTDVSGRLQEQAGVERCFSPTSHRLRLRDVLRQRPCLCAPEPLGDFSRVTLSNRFLERRKFLASATSCGNEFL